MRVRQQSQGIEPPGDADLFDRLVEAAERQQTHHGVSLVRRCAIVPCLENFAKDTLGLGPFPFVCGSYRRKRNIRFYECPIDRKSLPGSLSRFRKSVRRPHQAPELKLPQTIRNSKVGLTVVRIFHEGLFKMANCRLQCSFGLSVPMGSAYQEMVERAQVRRRAARKILALPQDLYPKRAGYRLRDLLLDLKDVFQFTVKRIGPDLETRAYLG